MKNILCFGDSNTWGYDPTSNLSQRYPIDVRWTSVLQKQLGAEYRIIEEGLNGRTTCKNLEDPDPMAPFLSGSEALPVILQTHRPLDLVIMILGTNDICIFDQTMDEITQQARTLCEFILNYEYTFDSCPQVLLISPIHITKPYESVSAAEKSLLFAE